MDQSDDEMLENASIRSEHTDSENDNDLAKDRLFKKLQKEQLSLKKQKIEAKEAEEEK